MVAASVNKPAQRRRSRRPHFEVYENPILLALKAEAKKKAEQTMKEFHDMLRKEQDSGGRIVYFERLVLTREINSCVAKYPQK